VIGNLVAWTSVATYIVICIAVVIRLLATLEKNDDVLQFIVAGAFVIVAGILLHWSVV
jgi:hypothetical protein